MNTETLLLERNARKCPAKPATPDPSDDRVRIAGRYGRLLAVLVVLAE